MMSDSSSPMEHDVSCSLARITRGMSHSVTLFLYSSSKQTLMSTFLTLLHELLHLFVSSTTANPRASTENINENKSSTQGSMPDSSDSQHEQYQSVLHPPQSFCTFCEPAWNPLLPQGLRAWRHPSITTQPTTSEPR